MFLMRNVCGLLLSVIIVFCAGCWNFRWSGEKMTLSSVARDESVVPVLILGGGCAGLYAAVYCAQANIPCVVIEGTKPGGSLAQSHSVRNWPGVINQPGAEIVAGVRKQAEQNGVSIVPEKVIAVDLRSWPRVVTTQRIDNPLQTKQYKALSVIIALGTEPNLLDIPGETGSMGYWGKGVSNCAVCEGSLYNGKDVTIVGGGDAAIVEADYLANIAAHVTLTLRSNAFRAKDIQARDRVLAKPNVKVLFNTEVVEIKGDGKTVTHLVLKNNTTGQQHTLAQDGLFLAIGSRANTTLFKGQLALDTRGLISLEDTQETAIRGVFAAGDVCDGEFMQGATALGDACKAALQARGFLKEIGFDAVDWKKAAHMVRDEALQTSSHHERRDQKRVSEDLSTHSYEITSNGDFEKHVMHAKTPVVIDLFATWCIPCQQMMPIVHEAANALQGQVAFVTMNVQNKHLDAQTLIGRLGGANVQGVPAFLCVVNGQEIGRLTGAMPLEKFVRDIRSIFNME